MADTKITALTAITTVDPAVDVLPIVDVSDTTMAASGTTKKITSNQILGAGGTATLASATITGDLTVDTSTLKVDSANNRVGIGTATPARPLDIVGSFQSTLGWVLTGTPAGLGAATRYIGGASTTDSWYYNAVTGGSHLWAFGESLAMTLNSTGLGVGTTVQYARLTVTGSNATGIANIQNSPFASNTGGSLSCYIGHDGNANRPFIQSATGNAGSAFDLLIQPYGGNVGIGVTPSAWGSFFKSIESGAPSAYVIAASNVNGVQLASNCYNDNTNWLYKTTGTAARFAVNTSQFQWFTAPSGTAGNAITFTQAMTLTAGGNLAVGVASTGNRLDVQNSTDCTVLVKSTGANANVALDYVSSYGNHTIRKSGTAVWDFGVINDASATPAFKVSNASAVGVQLVSGATSWTTLSDETVKDIIEPISNAVAKVGSIRSVIGKFKTDDSNKRRSFLIAQDVQSVLPEAVDVIGENNELGLRYTEVIPLLVAAIKELTAEVNALKNV